VNAVLGGADPLGRHFRYVGRGGDAYPDDVMGVALLSALGPARRGLRIQPMEALREE
jgi:hypothetical protein